MTSWKISTVVSQEAAKSALATQEMALEWDAEFVVSACEVDQAEPDIWAFEAWLPRKPGAADKQALVALFGEPAPKFAIEKLPETDWVVESQKGVEPIHSGRFCVHTLDHPPAHGAVNLAIPASLAFGTGQHETTAGCLAQLDAMKRQGVVIRNHADIGTGTGLLAFAAMRLWPKADAIASDIDPVCDDVVRENAALNGVTLGPKSGELSMVVAPGMDDPQLEARAPYDLLIANILAGPLIELAPDFARAVAPGGQLLLAGLLETQESAVRAAYSRKGFRLAQRLVLGDWSILWLRKRRVI